MIVENVCCKCGHQIRVKVPKEEESFAYLLRESKESECNVCESQYSQWERF